MTVKPQKQTGFGSPIWRVMITILGVALVLYGIFYMMLGVIGVPVSANVTSVKMQGDFQSNRLTGSKGTVIVDYTFTVPDGRSFSNNSTYKTDTDYNDPKNLEHFKTISVRYFSFLPQVNQVSALTDFRLDILALPVLGVLLIVLINWRAARYNKKNTI